MKKATVTREEVIRAMKAAARRLRRTPTRDEFTRISRIRWTKVQRLFGGYRVAVRAAGLEPDRLGLRIETAAMLADWGTVARKMGRHPTRADYERKGRFASASLETRFHCWSNVRERFLDFVQTNGIEREWKDVVENLRRGPVPRRGGGKSWLKASGDRVSGRSGERKATLLRSGAGGRGFVNSVPPQQSNSGYIRGVNGDLNEFTAQTLMRGAGYPEMSAAFPRRVFPGRPLLGLPLCMKGLRHEPVNEMGVVFLFGMLAPRLGFYVELLQAGYPDCEAKMEVEPGRCQHVHIEFELESRNFRQHGHDPAKCDVIVCWRHNWKGCPKHILVVELRKIIG